LPGTPDTQNQGFDELAEVKTQAAQRWVYAVNADGTHGVWKFVVARKMSEVREFIEMEVSNS